MSTTFGLANIISPIAHGISVIFHPLLVAIGYVLAWIYSIVPNYAVAIAILTLLVMAILTPLTIKSTRGQLAMQRIQPEMKKLQDKYKGSADRTAMNEEMMALYKEHGVNPLSSCLPMLFQMPFMSVLYYVVKGLSYTEPNKSDPSLPNAMPKYIPTDSRMYHDLVQAHGKMVSFGVDLAKHPMSPGVSTSERIVYFALVLIAVGLQYVLMWQIKKNLQSGTQQPAQMQAIQRFMPLIFAYIYFIVPAALTVYFIVSNLVRVGTQDLMFRTGAVTRNLKARPSEHVIPATSKQPSKKSQAVAARAAAQAEEDARQAKAHPRAKDKRKRKDR